MRQSFTLNSPDDTAKLASGLAKELNKNSCLALFGDFGVGKTFFTKQICNFLETENFATSPSFVILNIYNGSLPVFHFDLYRIKSSYELADLAIFDYFGKGVVIIEWAEVADDILPDECIRIFFSYDGKSKREVVIERKGTNNG